MTTVHAEIEYERIHSDVCPPKCSSKNLKNKEYRKFIHSVLDEWLDESKGKGGFYIKEEGYDFHYQ